MNRFFKMSIKNKLILLIFSVAVISQFVAFIAVSVERYYYLKTSLLNQSQMYAKLVGEYCISPLVFEDIDGLNQILQKTKALPEVLSVAVYNKDGNLVSSFYKDKDVLYPPKYEELHSQYQQRFLHIREKIQHKGIHYGSIHLKISLKLLNQELIRQMIILISIIICVTFLIYILANRFQKIISEPILKLTNTTLYVSEHEDYSIRLNSRFSDEIGQLYLRFNEMLEQIQIRSNQKDEAEKELMKLNKRLEQMVKERTEALEEKISELERFHDATIDREIRMKELLEEIEMLKTKRF